MINERSSDTHQSKGMLNDADSNFFKMESIRTERRESSNRKLKANAKRSKFESMSKKIESQNEIAKDSIDIQLNQLFEHMKKPNIIPVEPIIEKITPPIVETKIMPEKLRISPKKRLLSPKSRLAPSPSNNIELSISQDSSVNYNQK